ncbi:LysR family transcriptional regulator [Yanshouia hominis]|uniref:LysR family transcriptional regulator n=1 Tax=Yanshouia hominis TaxID=2763673 RepID=A0ABR7NNU0_9FIRM|nr:LysR family transcriptional regulator [Yanshouia hominis]MBC8577512.1 LysR family transcriptional regulator [Yanshouia hominis]
MTRYYVFLKVVETGSFTRAAQELDYTQSAVSQMIQTLEEELCATLFHRSKSGITLTPDGQEYLPFIRAVCNACDELRRKRREMEGLEGSVIRIGTFTSVSRNWLPLLIKQFKELYPSVQFELLQGEYTNISQWIKEGSVDFGFVNPTAVSGLKTIPLYQDEMLAVLCPGHPLAVQKRLTLRSLAAEPFILLDEGEHSVVLDAFASEGLTPNLQYKVYDDYSIVSMVEQGLGVSVLYRPVLQNIAQNLVTLPLDSPVTRTVAVACRDSRALSGASRTFLHFIEKHFGAR